MNRSAFARRAALASLLLTLAGTAGCASAPVASPPVPAATAERIEMEVRSWGRLLSRWSVSADGKAVLTRPQPDVFNARELVTRRVDIGTRGFAELRRMLADAERHAGRKLACEERLTDMPYGKVLWVGGSTAPAQLDFDSGCRDAPTRAVVDALQAADNLVADWTKTATIVERGPVPQE